MQWGHSMGVRKDIETTRQNKNQLTNEIPLSKMLKSWPNLGKGIWHEHALPFQNWSNFHQISLQFSIFETSFSCILISFCCKFDPARLEIVLILHAFWQDNHKFMHCQWMPSKISNNLQWIEQFWTAPSHLSLPSCWVIWAHVSSLIAHATIRLMQLFVLALWLVGPQWWLFQIPMVEWCSAISCVQFMWCVSVKNEQKDAKNWNSHWHSGHHASTTNNMILYFVVSQMSDNGMG